MPAREIALALALVAGSALVVAGVAMIHPPLAFMVAGVLLAALGILFLAEVD